MKRDHYYRGATNTAAGTSSVPFYEFVAPNLYVGEAVSAAFTVAYEALKRTVTAFNRWRWERVTRKALFELDSATLADIGIARSEIGAVARKAAENPTFTPTRRWRWTS